MMKINTSSVKSEFSFLGWPWRGSTLFGTALFFCCGSGGWLFWSRFGGDFHPLWDQLAMGGLVLAIMALGLGLRLLRLRGYGFYILEQTTHIQFKKRDEAVARAVVHDHCLYQALLTGQRVLRTRKYVRQPATMRGETLLSNWYYTATINSHSSKADHPVQPRAHLGETRALDLEFDLPKPLSEGETIRVDETFKFTSDLFLPGQSLLFSVPLPTRRRRLILSFEDVFPETITLEILNHEGGRTRLVSLPMVQGKTGNRQEAVLNWTHPKLNAEIRIAWVWPSSVTRAAQETVSSLNHEAISKMMDNQLASRLMKSTLAGDALSDVETIHHFMAETRTEEGDEKEESAEDHPLIKAARTRLGVLRKEE